MSKTKTPKPGPLARRVRKAREALGIDAHVASKRAGLAPSHVGAIERGSIANLKGETLIKLARALNTTAGWLLTGEGDAPG